MFPQLTDILCMRLGLSCYSLIMLRSCRQLINSSHYIEGYKETQISTLDCLADLVRHYIQSLSANVLECCETSGRAYPGIQDVMSIIGDSV